MQFCINHPDRTGIRPDYQNLLFGDGHGEGRGGSYYAKSLPDSIARISFCYVSQGASFFWEGSQ